MGCYSWYSQEGTGRGRSPPRPLLAVPNVTSHPSTASVPITVLLYYNGPLVCGFNAPIKWLTQNTIRRCDKQSTCLYFVSIFCDTVYIRCANVIGPCYNHSTFAAKLVTCHNVTSLLLSHLLILRLHASHANVVIRILYGINRFKPSASLI